MEQSDCTLSWEKIRWWSGLDVPVALPFGQCSGLRHDQLCSVFWMLALIFTSGTWLWRIMRQLSLRIYTMTGKKLGHQILDLINMIVQLVQYSKIIQQICNHRGRACTSGTVFTILFFLTIFHRVTFMAVFGEPAKQNTFSGIALARQSGKVEIQYFKESLTVPSTYDKEKLQSVLHDAFLIWDGFSSKSSKGLSEPRFKFISS